jgi:hypothetical protein
MKNPIIICRVIVIYIFCIILIDCLSIGSKPSFVNISSLENIKNYPMYGLEELKERFEKIKYIEGIIKFDSHDWKGDIGRCWVYSYDLQREKRGHVSLWIYDNQDNAKNNFEKWEKTSHMGVLKRIEKVSEDIDVILWHSEPNRVYFFSYVNDTLYTSIRIGNIIITLDEYFYKYKNEYEQSGMITTINIEIICKVLM